MPQKPSKVVLITGGSGLIGVRTAAALFGDAIVVATFHTNRRVRISGVAYCPMVVTDMASVQAVFAAHRPDVVVHIAGTKDLAACERSPGFAHRSHVVGTRNVVEAARRFASRLIYVSTDCVFDGSKERFTEDDETRPINVYGKVKLAGERLIAESGDRSLIVRASLVYGWQMAGQSSNTVVDVLRAAVRGAPLTLPSTLYNTPIFVDDLARILAGAVFSSDTGIIHAAGPDRLTRHELGLLTAGAFGMDARRVIRPSQSHSGIRPANSCLATRFPAKLAIQPRPLGDGLAAMRQQLGDARLRECVYEMLSQPVQRRL